MNHIISGATRSVRDLKDTKKAHNNISQPSNRKVYKKKSERWHRWVSQQFAHLIMDEEEEKGTFLEEDRQNSVNGIIIIGRVYTTFERWATPRLAIVC